MLNKIKSIIDNNDNGNLHYKKWDVGFRDDYFKKIYWSYFPITEKYYFEGNPSFLYEYRNSFDLCRYPIVTLRDGFIGLLEFFLMHPVPDKNFRSILLINKKFEKIIPKQWEDKVACYSILPRKKNPNNKGTIIFHGLALEDTFWMKSPIEIANELKEISKDFKKTVFLIPQRESLISSEQEQEKRYDIQFLKALYEAFGFNIKIEMQVEEFLKGFKEREFAFYNIDNNAAFVSDNYIDHYFYSIGGININSHSSTCSEGIEYNLSSNHKVLIEEVNFTDNSFSKFYLPHKISGRKNVSIYDVYRSRVFQKTFKEIFD